MKKNILLICFVSFILGLGGCCDKNNEVDNPIEIPQQNVETSSRLETELSDEYGIRDYYGTYANLAEKTILEKDFEHFAELVDENEGVRFYQYGFEANGNGFILTKSALLNNNPNTKYVRGIYDGSGFPIEKTIGEYFDEFLNEKLFNNGRVEYAAEEMKETSDYERLTNLFPESIFVEYYYEGHEEYDYMDREKLYVVLNPIYNDEGNRERRVVAILHDQRTV